MIINLIITMLFNVFLNSQQVDNIQINNQETKSVNVSSSVKAIELTEKEFDKILVEAEKKLKMEKHGKLSDYVFKLLPVKKEMNPSQTIDIINFAIDYPDLMIKLMTKEVELSPKNTDAYHERAGTYYTLCMKEKSFESYKEKEIRLRYCELSIKDIDMALKYTKTNEEKSIGGLPRRVSLYLLKAQIYRSVYKDYKKAIENYTNAINSDPIQPNQVYLDRGNLYALDMKDYKNALSDLQRYMEFVKKYELEKTKQYLLESFILCQKIYKELNIHVSGCASLKYLNDPNGEKMLGKELGFYK